MAGLLFSPALRYGLTGLAVVFAALGAFQKKPPLLWALLSGLCTAAGVLLALLQGLSLSGALPTAMAPAAAALAGLVRKGGGGA